MGILEIPCLANHSFFFSSEKFNFKIWYFLSMNYFLTIFGVRFLVLANSMSKFIWL
jgi:hypothetical protein